MFKCPYCGGVVSEEKRERISDPPTEGRIVEAAREKCASPFSLEFAKSIQSEIEELGKEYQALRNLFRNHERRLRALGVLKAVKEEQSSKNPSIPDAKGEMHELKVGKSVVDEGRDTKGLYMGKYKQTKNAIIFLGDEWDSGSVAGALWDIPFDQLTFLFDLDLPEPEGGVG